MIDRKPAAPWRSELARVVVTTGAAGMIYFADVPQHRGIGFFLSAWLIAYGIFFLAGRLYDWRWKRLVSVVAIGVLISSAGFALKSFLSTGEATIPASGASL